MKTGTLFSDTLFKRLFVLMWVALVASHLAGFFAARSVDSSIGGPPGAAVHLPPLPSLPPGFPGTDGPDGPRQPAAEGFPPARGMDAPADRPAGDAPRFDGAPAEHGARPPAFQAGPPRLPARALWLDYLVRALVIGIAAYLGARWLSKPMRRLSDAARALGQTLGAKQAPAPLDERAGTVEVRETARVFNGMAHRLAEQFDAQALTLAAISHDLRTPLTRLRLRLEAMDATPQTGRCIDDVRQMDGLIGAVLETMRMRFDGSATLRRLDLGALVQSLVDDLAEQGQPVRFEAPPDGASPQVMGEPASLQRVAGNLVGNALRYGGAATLSWTLTPDRVELQVDDAGPGIPEAQLEAVFRPFFRLDAARGAATGGSGLGLYIARELAARSGGTIVLANRSQGGLRATLSLPRPA